MTARGKGMATLAGEAGRGEDSGREMRFSDLESRLVRDHSLAANPPNLVLALTFHSNPRRLISRIGYHEHHQYLVSRVESIAYLDASLSRRACTHTRLPTPRQRHHCPEQPGELHGCLRLQDNVRVHGPARRWSVPSSFRSISSSTLADPVSRAVQTSNGSSHTLVRQRASRLIRNSTRAWSDQSRSGSTASSSRSVPASLPFLPTLLDSP